jgi:histone-lysine N-methyltransferase SETD3
MALPKREDNWDSFKKWCFDNNIDLSKVIIDRIDDKQGFGLRAVSDLKQSELILTIPRKVMITSETAIKDINLGLVSF